MQQFHLTVFLNKVLSQSRGTARHRQQRGGHGGDPVQGGGEGEGGQALRHLRRQGKVHHDPSLQVAFADAFASPIGCAMHTYAALRIIHITLLSVLRTL